MTGNIHGRLNRCLEGTVKLEKLIFMDFAPAIFNSLAAVVVIFTTLPFVLALPMLLVVPEQSARWGTDYTLEPGDRLCAGVGPELTWDQWQTFVPAARDDVAVVAYVLPLTLGGRAHHLEAGAWWNGGGTGAHSLTN